jgi:L-asparaginase II
MAPHVLAEIIRNGVVESIHCGSAVVLDPTGQVRFAVGIVDQPVYGRSSNKPMQGVAMVEAGLPLTGPHLAVAVASHSAEQFHLDAVADILAMAGLGIDDLGCIVDPPYSPSVAQAMWRSGRSPSRLTMNCSGKHAAMLLTCSRRGWDRSAYLDRDQPLTRHITEVIHRLCGERPAHIGVDGCGAPAHTLSLTALARSLQRIVLADTGSPEHRVASAMRDHPEYVGGTGRDDTVLMQHVAELVSKEGADGVHVAALGDGSAVALKIADGGARARLPIVSRLLEIAGADVSALDDIRRPPVLGGGQRVGEIRCVI